MDASMPSTQIVVRSELLSFEDLFIGPALMSLVSILGRLNTSLSPAWRKRVRVQERTLQDGLSAHLSAVLRILRKRLSVSILTHRRIVFSSRSAARIQAFANQTPAYVGAGTDDRHDKHVIPLVNNCGDTRSGQKISWERLLGAHWTVSGQTPAWLGLQVVPAIAGTVWVSTRPFPASSWRCSICGHSYDPRRPMRATSMGEYPGLINAIARSLRASGAGNCHVAHGIPSAM